MEDRTPNPEPHLPKSKANLSLPNSEAHVQKLEARSLTREERLSGVEAQLSGQQARFLTEVVRLRDRISAIFDEATQRRS